MMARINRVLARLRDCAEGAMIIETAIVTPVLVMISVGIYDSGRLFERQMFLQSAIGQATAIALAANSGATTDINTVKQMLVDSTTLPADQVVVEKKYRCAEDTTLLDSPATCNPSGEISTYLKVSLTDHYTPMWTDFGVGRAIDFTVTRTAQIA